MGGRNSWKDYFESLSPLLRSDLERKRRVIGFSLEEWGAVVEALFEERADEWRAFRQTMSKIEFGYGLRDWALTCAAIILENQPAIPLIQKRWGEMFELVMAEMTTERLRGRREALTRLQTITN